MYGVGFLAALPAAFFVAFHRRQALVWSGVTVAVALLLIVLKSCSPPTTRLPAIRLAGLPLEYPSELELLPALAKLASTNATFDLLVLPENTLEGAPARSLAGVGQRRGDGRICAGPAHRPLAPAAGKAPGRIKLRVKMTSPGDVVRRAAGARVTPSWGRTPAP